MGHNTKVSPLGVIFGLNEAMTVKSISGPAPAAWKPAQFSLSNELKTLAVTWQQYWTLILSIGLFFGWLLSFPMQGPLFTLLVQSWDSDPLSLITYFLVGHVIGLLGAGILGHFARRYLVWFSLAGIPCTVLSMAALGIPNSIWMFAGIGLLAGLAAICWGAFFSSEVSPHLRGRTFIMAAVIANLILYAITLTAQSENMNVLLYIIGCLPLAMPVLIIYRYLKISPTVTEATVNEDTVLPYVKVGLRLLLPFIFAIYAVGGLMYSVIGQISTPPGGLWYIYGLAPYIIFLLIAGPLADNYGRRLNGLIGAIVVGIGFMLIGLLRGVPQFLAAQTLLVGGYAFLDTFTWVIAADVASRRKTSLFYGIVLSANILAILTGVLLGGKIEMLASGSEVLTVSLAGLFSFISLVFIFKLGETLPRGRGISAAQRPIAIEELAGKTGLTPREIDIGKLLIAGKTTPEILEELAIAPDTLKTHLRNIYHKVGAKNRLDFTLRVMKGNEPAEGNHSANSDTD